MTTTHVDADALELEALGRKYAGLVHQARVEGLGRRLRDRAIQVGVRRSIALAGGRKLTLWLADGTVLRLHLYWPERREVASVCAIDWDDRIGWAIDLTLSNGDTSRVYAWRVRHDHPRPAIRR
jgi:hypothetical protein